MNEAKMPCEVYSRVAGYYRPVQCWNAGKQEEFKHRATFDKVFERRKIKNAAQKEDSSI